MGNKLEEGEFVLILMNEFDTDSVSFLQTWKGKLDRVKVLVYPATSVRECSGKG